MARHALTVIYPWRADPTRSFEFAAKSAFVIYSSVDWGARERVL